MICRICVKYAHLVHLLHFYLPQGANFQKFYSKGSILPGSACTCREKRSGKEGKHPSTSTSSLFSRDPTQVTKDPSPHLGNQERHLDNQGPFLGNKGTNLGDQGPLQVARDKLRQRLLHYYMDRNEHLRGRSQTSYFSLAICDQTSGHTGYYVLGTKWKIWTLSFHWYP